MKKLLVMLGIIGISFVSLVFSLDDPYRYVYSNGHITIYEKDSKTYILLENEREKTWPHDYKFSWSDKNWPTFSKDWEEDYSFKDWKFIKISQKDFDNEISALTLHWNNYILWDKKNNFSINGTSEKYDSLNKLSKIVFSSTWNLIHKVYATEEKAILNGGLIEIASNAIIESTMIIEDGSILIISYVKKWDAKEYFLYLNWEKIFQGWQEWYNKNIEKKIDGLYFIYEWKKVKINLDRIGIYFKDKSDEKYIYNLKCQSWSVNISVNNTNIVNTKLFKINIATKERFWYNSYIRVNEKEYLLADDGDIEVQGCDTKSSDYKIIFDMEENGKNQEMTVEVKNDNIRGWIKQQDRTDIVNSTNPTPETQSWYQPLPEKQELAVQKVVQIINKKWVNYKGKVLAQLSAMKSKIWVNRIAIYDRLVYLLSSDTKGSITTPNKRKNVPSVKNK